jgi:AraC-like DNA-binding protein
MLAITGRRVLDFGVAAAENLCRTYPSPEKEPARCSPAFKIAFPYRGFFLWHVGGQDVAGDPNQILFVRPSEQFRISSPSPRASGELILTPDLEVLAELARTSERGLFDHHLFRRRATRATPCVQLAAARFVQRAMDGRDVESLEFQEALLALMRSAIRTATAPRPIAEASARLVRRTKALLSERFTERLRLRDVSTAVGASPTYLTGLFTRAEGVSLHQYLTQLRVSRALLELPHATELTALALELGFSSHSHFSLAFRRVFGCTPSQFRELTRKQARIALSARY